ncbi:PIG-L deacetylase family protein [Longimicrobium terrae]|uniref:LmbE family N-acetylglucosaminyl deacetylase n=1 Tax=Longimicrobium terrae TaxID=1639882 RepID=A0A841H591_9BACT|nr:PIG-L deacetylase family protein [Longimicrobium terrae]MBB4638863.1 LmbE family N-acetylglucosaminyl deacetylase [Longimicrobium terrae]MBB6073102.1 LmbE family N-acetylglucosaminyl deacetylase [Longimicrobium terrae]NNC30207.1 PIG-L family deacetylase [Longimicrobium terrae]
MASKTLLVGLAHPDDEVGAAGTMLAQRARGDRVVVVWLTRGEMTEAFGPIPSDEVAAIRTEHGRIAGEILGVETRFLDFHDCSVHADPAAARQVAQVIAEFRPDALITWGDAWGRGMRHPDHQASGKIFRDAITLARIAKVVGPTVPHREAVPVFTYRGAHSTLPAVAVDVSAYRDQIHELGRFYRESIGFGDADWIDQRLRMSGEPFGLQYAEVYDAWETRGGLFPSLLPAELEGELRHPDRPL